LLLKRLKSSQTGPKNLLLPLFILILETQIFSMVSK
jgi:hypothetical protein